MLCIANLIKEYEKNAMQPNSIFEDGNKKLCRKKEVTELYPALTNYMLDRAIKEDKLPVVKIGNVNYFDLSDIEEFIELQKQNKKVKVKPQPVTELVSGKFV